LVWLLLLSLAWLGPVLGEEQKDGQVGAEEEKEKEEDEVLSDEIKEEDNVLVLHEHNFARALSEHRLLLVEFCECPHCGQGCGQGHIVGRDRGVGQGLWAGGWWHREGCQPVERCRGDVRVPLHVTGRMDTQGIVRWMQRRAGPSATLLQDTDTAAAFVDSQDLVVVGFFKDLGGKAAQVFYEVAAEMVDVPFGVAEAAELFQAYGLSADTVCLFKKVRRWPGVVGSSWLPASPHQPLPWQFDDRQTDFPVDPEQGLDTAELMQLIRVHSLQLVMEFTNEVRAVPVPISVLRGPSSLCPHPPPPPQTSNQIFSAKIPHHMLLFLNKSSSEQLLLQESFRAAAGAFRGEVLFVVVDVNGHGADVLPFFGMTPADAPTLRLVRMENNRKYQMDQDTFSAAAIGSFIRAVLDGRVKPRLLSAEPPEDWDTRPVKVLVGKTFEQVAYDETKNVFVKFYAPWCSHCQAMAAAWEELAERYKDHEDIVIAEMDATANELENITIHGFPTLHYFPAGPGRKMVEYKSTRDVETFSKFLENGGTLP
ncbi:PDIA2 isomerase, partial [Smithornis capensis]|nr:PDIA2 isomerase [Smithornis capensis]